MAELLQLGSGAPLIVLDEAGFRLADELTDVDPHDEDDPDHTQERYSWVQDPEGIWRDHNDTVYDPGAALDPDDYDGLAVEFPWLEDDGKDKDDEDDAA